MSEMRKAQSQPINSNSLVERLTTLYPDSALALRGKTTVEVAEYLAKLELIEHIKLIIENGD